MPWRLEQFRHYAARGRHVSEFPMRPISLPRTSARISRRQGRLVWIAVWLIGFLAGAAEALGKLVDDELLLDLLQQSIRCHVGSRPPVSPTVRTQAIRSATC